MKNLKKQTKSGQCGVYNLANIMRNESIIHEFGEAPSFIPAGNHESNKILSLFNYDWRLESIILPASWRLKIPFSYFKRVVNHLLTANPDTRYFFMPFVLYVYCGGGRNGLHAVSILCHKGMIALSDPLINGFELIDSLDTLLHRYNYVNAVSSFVNLDGDFVSFTHEFYNYTKLFEL